MLELATARDRAAVEALAREVHAMHIAWRPDIFQMPEELYPEDRFQAEIAARRLYVAKLDGQTVGYVLLSVREYDWPSVVRRRVMEVSEICVEPSLRNHGVGKAMLADIRALARAFRCTDLQLGVYAQNDGAVAFYQKCGFRIRTIQMDSKL